MRKSAVCFAVLLFFVSSLAAQGEYYVVKKGDSLSKIAATYSITVEQLTKANKLDDPDKIKIGMKLLIPNFHLVIRGETYYSIATMYDMKVKDLLALNSRTEKEVLLVGEKLIVTGKPVIASNVQVTATQVSNPVSNPSTDMAVSHPDLPMSGQAALYKGKLSGILIKGTESQIVTAVMGGEVVLVTPFMGLGNVIIIETKPGESHVYCGNGQVFVRQGQKITPGQKLGEITLTPLAEIPALLYCIYRDDKPVDMKVYLK